MQSNFLPSLICYWRPLSDRRSENPHQSERTWLAAELVPILGAPTVSSTTRRTLNSAPVRLCRSERTLFTKAANRQAKQGPRYFHLTLPPITTIGANDTTKRDETRLQVEENNWSSPSRVIIAKEKKRRVEMRGRQWGGDGGGSTIVLCFENKNKKKR